MASSKSLGGNRHLEHSFWKLGNLKRKRQKHTVFLGRSLTIQEKHDTHLTIANFGEKTILQLLNCEFQILQSICGFWFASPLVFINLTCWGWPLTCWGWPIHRRPLGCHDTMGIGKANKLRGQTVREVVLGENWGKNWWSYLISIGQFVKLGNLPFK